MNATREGQFWLEFATCSPQVFIETMRSHARRIARNRGHVTTDDLRPIAVREGMNPQHANQWGGVFRSPEFVQAGYIRSRLPSNHGRRITRWALAAPGRAAA